MRGSGAQVATGQWSNSLTRLQPLRTLPVTRPRPFRLHTAPWAVELLLPPQGDAGRPREKITWVYEGWGSVFSSSSDLASFRGHCGAQQGSREAGSTT